MMPLICLPGRKGILTLCIEQVGCLELVGLYPSYKDSITIELNEAAGNVGVIFYAEKLVINVYK